MARFIISTTPKELQEIGVWSAWCEEIGVDPIEAAGRMNGDDIIGLTGDMAEEFIAAHPRTAADE